MLAKALRDDPEFNTAKVMAEFSEPYGTIASVNRIREGNADPFDYLAAIPVVGIPARYAKRFKTIQKAADEAKKFKSREILTEMNIDEFLNLAEGGYDANKAKGLKGVEQFDDVPFLDIDSSIGSGSSRVVGHEGRHRARRLKELGESTMPVSIRDRHIRFDQQSAPGFDKIDEAEWPRTIVSQDGKVVGDFPIKQGDWGEAEERISMALRSRYKAKPKAASPSKRDIDELLKELGIKEIDL